ncbi:MAG TPA: Crp/Fnr family transcriptional regulator [Candidatus Saccharimonadales bacterium]|nr:Crp/Fnr family transcriptional regulator [Candidatus Saccharimonadales bacterium]
MAITDLGLTEFFDSGRQRKFSAGEIVMRGEEPSGVVIVRKGFVRVYSISDDGNHYVHIIYKTGEIFPLIWAFNDILRRVFYEALSELEVTEVPKQDFLRFIKHNAGAATDVLKQLAEQFYVFADRLDNLEYKTASEKVAYRLMFLASRFGEHQGKTIIIKAPLTHELISQSINLARETVSREIENLEKLGIISHSGKYILINDVEKLSHEFSEPITLNLWGLTQD